MTNKPESTICSDGLCETCKYFDQGDNICDTCSVQLGQCHGTFWVSTKQACDVCRWSKTDSPTKEALEQESRDLRRKLAQYESGAPDNTAAKIALAVKAAELRSRKDGLEMAAKAVTIHHEGSISCYCPVCPAVSKIRKLAEEC